MKKLRFSGVCAAIALAAGVLILAGCDSPTGGGGQVGNTTEPGAAIAVFTLTYDGLSSTAFTVTSTATVGTPNPGGQAAEYAINNSTTAPADSGSWRATNLTFSGLTPDTDYYVFARAASTTVGTVTYLAGAPTPAAGPVRTRPSGEDASVNTGWNPSFSYTSDTGTSFTFTQATPAVTGRVVQYTLASTNDVTSPPADDNWQDSRTFQIRLLSTTTPFYVWARTKESPGVQKGVALAKEVRLPGVEISSENWRATAGSVTGNSAQVTITGDFMKTPDVAVLEIDFGLSASATSADGAVWVPRVAGQTTPYTFSGLSSETDYHLWVRSRGVTNFSAGTALKYNSTSTARLLRTTGIVTSAEGLANALKDGTTNPNGVAYSPGNTIVTILNTTPSTTVTLRDAINIPPSVTIVIEEGATLDAARNDITGSGWIHVASGGTLIAGYGRIDVGGVTINSGATYSLATPGASSTTTIDTLIDDGTDGPLNLTAGTITIKPTGSNSYEYSLDTTAESKAEIEGATFYLYDRDTFIVRRGATLTVTDGTSPPPDPPTGLIAGNGTIEVEAGGTLVIPAISNLQDLETNGKLVIKAGANVTISNYIIITHNNLVPNFPAETTGTRIILDSGGEVTISNQYNRTITPNRWEPKITISGNADIAVDNTGAFTTYSNLYEVAAGATVTIRRGVTFTVSGTDYPTTVNGNLILAAGGSNANETGGKLSITVNAELIVGGTVTVNPANTPTRTHSFNLKNDSGGGILTLNNGAVNVVSGAYMDVSGGTVRGAGTVNVQGNLYTSTGNNFNEFGSLDSTSGRVVISGGGELYMGTIDSNSPYINFDRTANPPSPGNFFLAATGSPQIEISSLTVSNINYPRFTLTGNAFVTAATTQIYGQFVIGGGAILTMNNGASLYLNHAIVALDNRGTLAVAPNGTASIDGVPGAWVSGNWTTGTAISFTTVGRPANWGN